MLTISIQVMSADDQSKTSFLLLSNSNFHCNIWRESTFNVLALATLNLNQIETLVMTYCITLYRLKQICISHRINLLYWEASLYYSYIFKPSTQRNKYSFPLQVRNKNLYQLELVWVKKEQIFVSVKSKLQERTKSLLDSYWSFEWLVKCRQDNVMVFTFENTFVARLVRELLFLLYSILSLGLNSLRLDIAYMVWQLLGSTSTYI